MRKRMMLIAALMATVGLSATALAQATQPAMNGQSAPAADNPAANALKAQVVEAYQRTTQYESKVSFTMRQIRGRWRQEQSGDFAIALDRPTGKLMIDKPDLLLVSDGKKVRVKSDEIAERFLEIDAPAPMTYEAISEQVRFLNRPLLPDVMLLLAADPVAALTEGAGGAVGLVEPEAGDAQKRPGLAVDHPMGRLVLRVDPASKLVTRAVLNIDAQGRGGQPGDSASLVYDLQIKTHNKPVEGARFAFDGGALKASSSLREWVTGNAPAAEAGHPLEGQVAPAFSLMDGEGKAYKLADDKSAVIVLDFWATWCGPCLDALPKVQKVAEWAKAEKKSVAVFAVNLQETSEQVKECFKQNKLALPYLLDSKGDVAQAYGVQGIPQTVIIKGGKVMHVHVGAGPDVERILKSQINALLADTKPADKS